MPPKGHAVLSTSASHRWLHCQPSARLCESYDDKGSDYAVEGTDTHELCEYKLKKALGMEATDPTEKLTWYSEEIVFTKKICTCFISALQLAPIRFKKT